jgi:predicted dehydrogenase
MNSKKIRWGVLSTAKIGMEKVIPAMQKCKNLEIRGISSRNAQNARRAAEKLGIPKYYEDYESMLHDPEIDAIYNPLPNHLHFEWTKKAMEKGKHVLCEKPMTLDKNQVLELITLRDRVGVKVGEAFMVHTHPQWLDAVQRIKDGELGKLKSIQGFFSYYKTDPANIRNILEYGGGAMWDIGCYPVHTSRYAFGEEPTRVVSLIDRDPDLRIDRQASVMMDFPSGQCIFTVSTQLVPYQRMIFFGDKKKLEIEIPFNAPNDRASNIFIDEGGLPVVNPIQITFDTSDQYQIQGEQFSDAILKDTEVPVSLENAYANTAVIEAVFQSALQGKWISI